MNELLQEIKKRGISRLCHFTNSRSFIHIIQSDEGITANSFLQEEKEKGILKQNDNKRLDGRLDYISCSIEYPNTWYLRNIKKIDPNFKDWVILLIDPTIMLDDNTLFCHRNAAAGYGQYLEKGLEGFKGMFRQTVNTKFTINRTPKMLNCCPTDGQAEVMIYKTIPKKSILGVCVPSREQARLELLKLSHLPISKEELNNISWVIAPDLFELNWSPLIKRGIRPEEIFLSEAELDI